MFRGDPIPHIVDGDSGKGLHPLKVLVKNGALACITVDDVVWSASDMVGCNQSSDVQVSEVGIDGGAAIRI